MCRIFAFKSVFSSQVHQSLVHADDALVTLSERHSDGWGVAYYSDEIPHLIRSNTKAIDDKIFHKVSGIVSSQTVVAHIRKATLGENSILNSHPFQFGKWIFAHNGSIKNFSSNKSKLMSLVSLPLQKYILGDTDSEIIFYIILSALSKRNLLRPLKSSESKQYIDCIRQALKQITQISGSLNHRITPKENENYLTFVLTDGQMIFALQGGQPLSFSTHKQLCSQRSSCSYYDRSCENPVGNNSHVNHLLVSSEVVRNENIWTKLDFGELVALDANMIFSKQKVSLPLADQED